jgi:hypothetical protein
MQYVFIVILKFNIQLLIKEVNSPCIGFFIILKKLSEGDF